MNRPSDREQTAYCGLWCGSCISGNSELFAAARKLLKLLDEAKFENYAAFKAVSGKHPVPAFAHYDKFRELLAALPSIACEPTCFNGPCSEAVGCTPDCKLRRCPVEKGLAGCWECDERDTCPAFLELDSRHPELKDNIRLLNEHGVDDWARFREEIDIWEELRKRKGE